MILKGCTVVPDGGCPVWGLLKKYNVSYVEIDSSGANPTDTTGNSADVGWWASQGLPVVGRSSHITVYDVRAHG